VSELADHYRSVAADFSRVVDAVPADAWDRPAPCEGWVARDVVRHLVEWVPGFFGERWGIAVDAPSVDADPAGAWHALDAAVRAALDADASTVADTPFGPQSLEQAIGMIVTGDVLVHTWDLARATGGDERLDPDAVHRLFEGMEAMDESMRASGHFGPRVEVPADADEQTRLLAFTGRRP
jgi:uncharacterized protein (TIGR03086 family)